jgi:hypothetical protein
MTTATWACSIPNTASRDWHAAVAELSARPSKAHACNELAEASSGTANAIVLMPMSTFLTSGQCAAASRSRADGRSMVWGKGLAAARLRMLAGILLLAAGVAVALSDTFVKLATAVLQSSGTDRIVNLALLLHRVWSASGPDAVHFLAMVSLVAAGLPLLTSTATAPQKRV